MSTAGPSPPGTAANNAGSGDTAWANPNNCKVQDGTVTTANFVLSGGIQSQNLVCSNFGFSTTGTINGITGVVRRRNPNTGIGECADAVVQLSKTALPGAGLVGSNKASGTNWPGSLADATYGGVADLWGTTWTTAEINASGFAIVIQVNDDGASLSQADIDFVSITVTYTGGGAIGGGSAAIQNQVTNIIFDGTFFRVVKELWLPQQPKIPALNLAI